MKIHTLCKVHRVCFFYVPSNKCKDVKIVHMLLLTISKSKNYSTKENKLCYNELWPLFHLKWSKTKTLDNLDYGKSQKFSLKMPK